MQIFQPNVFAVRIVATDKFLLFVFGDVALISWGARTKYHKLSSLKQQKYILPEFWTLDVENQRVGRAALLLKSVGATPSLPLPGVQWWPPAPRAPWLALNHPSLCVIAGSCPV